MIVYIAGPMTGLPNKNSPAFHALAAQLTEGGCTVLNPATLPAGLSYEQYMDIDLAMVRACQAVVTLPGWEDSPGATAEVAYARCIGKHIIAHGCKYPPAIGMIRELGDGSGCAYRNYQVTRKFGEMVEVTA